MKNNSTAVLIFSSSGTVVKSNRKMFTKIINIYIYLPIILYQFISFIPSTYSSSKPLIFNPQTLEIYDIGDKLMTYKNGPYAAACPATNDHERKFNEKYSLNHRSLFMRHYSKKKDGLIHRIRCRGNIELAVAYYNDSVSKKRYLRFGYEIYFVQTRHPKDINRISSYFKYERVFKSTMEHFLDFFWRLKRIPTMTEDGTPILLNMGFIWISKTTFGFNESKWIVDGVMYSIDKMIDQPVTECSDHALHNELYKSWQLYNFYLPENQEEIFNSVKLQDDDCNPKNVCVTKHTLVPAYQFQINDSKVASCTNLATVPVWSNTTDPLLDHLDKFLFAVSQVLNNLTIFLEVYETLILPLANTENPKSKYMYLYPNDKNKILPIPKLIFKLAIYHSHNCDESKTLCWFHVVIVIHNEPKVDKITDKLCAEDKCKKLGWERIQYPNKAKPDEKSEHIYCCEMNANIKKIFGFSDLIKYEDLNLTSVQIFNQDTKEFTNEDKLNQIENEMNYLFGDKTSSARQKSWTPTTILAPQDVNYVYV